MQLQVEVAVAQAVQVSTGPSDVGTCVASCYSCACPLCLVICGVFLWVGGQAWKGSLWQGSSPSPPRCFPPAVSHPNLFLLPGQPAAEGGAQMEAELLRRAGRCWDPPL